MSNIDEADTDGYVPDEVRTPVAQRNINVSIYDPLTSTLSSSSSSGYHSPSHIPATPSPSGGKTGGGVGVGATNSIGSVYKTLAFQHKPVTPLSALATRTGIPTPPSLSAHLHNNSKIASYGGGGGASASPPSSTTLRSSRTPRRMIPSVDDHATASAVGVGTGSPLGAYSAGLSRGASTKSRTTALNGLAPQQDRKRSNTHPNLSAELGETF
ncbi:hypothetical protein KEM54_002146 [Ascosphaera aggregata]|nr:hypothetical protein KEM54_002146 [Ascosphaera aggregata]